MKSRIIIDITYDEEGTVYKPHWTELKNPIEDITAGLASVMAEVLKRNDNPAGIVGFVSDILHTSRNFLVRAEDSE